MIELISAKGNTSLESALKMAKEIRWHIQTLGIRLEKAANAEETSRKKNARASTKAVHEAELRLIVYDIKKLLVQLDEYTPFFNLAMTTSGAKLTTSLPPTVSPSRMMQAGHFLTAADMAYSMNPGIPTQVGPTFTLSLYMLYAGHSTKVYGKNTTRGAAMRGATWKEVIHKARMRLMRIPLDSLPSGQDTAVLDSIELRSSIISGETKQNEYAYHMEIIEDLDDDRAHSFEEGEPQPGPYGDIPLAGVREFIPIHQVARIWYADTGKILRIGNDNGANNPVLLLKRNSNASPPRTKMQERERSSSFGYDEQEEEDYEHSDSDDGQGDIDQQIHRESSAMLPSSPVVKHREQQAWKLPADLDPEWLALEVYVEEEDSSSDDDERDPSDEQDPTNDSAYASHRPSSSGQSLNTNGLAEDLAHLDINPASSPSPRQLSPHPAQQPPPQSNAQLGPIRTSLSLLEMLLRLASLQQFLQNSHLAATDEILTFFLDVSSTIGGDADERKRVRNEATQKVGFDPWDESPIKHHGEDYQRDGQYANHEKGAWDGHYSRGGSPWPEYGQEGNYPSSPRFRERERSMTPQQQGTPEPYWLLRNKDNDSRRNSPMPVSMPPPPSSPISPYKPHRKTTRPVDRVQQESRVPRSSPLGRGGRVDVDSTLGMSPSSPTLVQKGGGS